MTDIAITPQILARLAERSSYEVPPGGIVFFGFRGLLPFDLAGTPFAASHKVRLVSFDHRHMRCALGQWKPAEGTLALFPGSTVPHTNAVRQAAGANGIGANMLMLGRYAYDRGIHKAGSRTAHRAFRQGMFFPVWRNADDLDFDLADRLDTSGRTPEAYPWDNLHCAHADNVELPSFSSNGCQVVAGRPSTPANGNAPESGPWKRFVSNAYGPEADGQTRFTYLLFSGNEAGTIGQKPDGPLSRYARFGSRGPWVAKVQQALRDRQFPFLGIDSDFGRDTLEAVMGFQAAEFGPGQADGVVGPNTASALGIDWPAVTFAAAPVPPPPVVIAPAPAATPPAAPAAAPPADWIAAATKITPGFEVSGDPYLGVSGDFDGMGISCGALQWNIGQKSLQPMVRAVGEPAVTAAMPTCGADLWKACKADTPIRTALALARAWQTGTRLSPQAKAELRGLMGLPAMRAEQDRAIGQVAASAFTQATKWATAAGRAQASKREFVWFFDLLTQNGGLEGLTIVQVRDFIDNAGTGGADDVICDFLAGQSGNSGHARDAQKNAVLWRGAGQPLHVELLVASYLRSKTAVPKWRHVVLNRKGTLAMGIGWVNSTKHDHSALLGTP